MLSSATERQFEIIGEALAPLVRRFPATAELITRKEEIISFRNMLIHGYSFVNDEVVWSTIHTDLPSLHDEVNALLAED
jgi:uncharacterized protein with HEPN domain